MSKPIDPQEHSADGEGMPAAADLRRLTEYVRKLELRNRDLERFAALASHDLQAPLRSIAEFTRLVAEELQVEAEGRVAAYLNRIITSSDRLRSLVADLLRLSRIGNEDFEPEAVCLESVLEEVKDSMLHELEERSVRLVAEDLPTVSGDPILLATVLRNLIGNSIKFQQPDNVPTVEIRATPGNGWWEVEVCDNGIGLDAEWKEQVFLAFQRLHSRDRYPGNGLGLTICRKIVEEVHGGAIRAEPSPMGGTCVRFTLPDANLKAVG